MIDQNIICFAKDWEEHPTSNNHVMRELARQGNRVLWLNSIGTRAPNLACGRDIGKIVRKLKSFGGGPRSVAERMWVYTPVVLPFPDSSWATAANRLILRVTLNSLRRRLGMHHFQLWTFLPNVADYLGTLGECVSVYYCTDEWSQFNYVDGPRIAAAERNLCMRVDVVFATARSLVERLAHINAETHLATHGVHHELFARALDQATLVPDDLALLPRPVLGFYGTIQDWVDFDLIAFLARRHPEWSIALIGDVLTDTSPIKRYANVHLLGRRPHGVLPNYCKGFDVGLIPYNLNERISHVNPLKLREYLCAGLPVVSTALPEVWPYRRLCAVAHDFEAFEQGIIDAIRSDSTEMRRCRSEAMRSESWECKVSAVAEHVLRVMQGRSGTGAVLSCAPPSGAAYEEGRSKAN